MKIGDEKTILEIIQEIARGKIKKDLELHYEWGLRYRLYIDDLKLIAYNGTGLRTGKVLNEKFKLEGYYKKSEI
jgi:hypothetical protein